MVHRKINYSTNLDNSKVMCPIGVSTLWFIVGILAVLMASVATGIRTSRTVEKAGKN